MPVCSQIVCLSLFSVISSSIFSYTKKINYLDSSFCKYQKTRGRSALLNGMLSSVVDVKDVPYIIRCRRLCRRLRRRLLCNQFKINMNRMMFLLFLLMYEEEQKKKENNNQKTRCRGRYKAALSAEGKRRRDRRIPRVSLLMPWASPWEKVYSSANDQSLITLTGFDCASFNQLHERFCQFFNCLTPHMSKDGKLTFLKRQIGGQLVSHGRKWIITSDTCLGLLLVYNRTTVTIYTLSCLFGVSSTAVSLYTRFARLIVLRILKYHPDAKITLPSNQKVAEYKQAICAKYPLLTDVYSVCDGFKISIQAAGQHHEQIRFYNGWQKGHCVSNIFVFVPDGTIIAVAACCPGSMHDSYVADLGFIYSKLEEVHDRVPGGAQCVMDSAFCSVGRPYVIKSIQSIHRAVNAQDYLMLEQATSMRQAAEWGMYALRSSFGRLQGTLRYETKGQRNKIIESIVLLHNWRANTVGINQIKLYSCRI